MSDKIPVENVAALAQLALESEAELFTRYGTDDRRRAIDLFQVLARAGDDVLQSKERVLAALGALSSMGYQYVPLDDGPVPLHPAKLTDPVGLSELEVVRSILLDMPDRIGERGLILRAVTGRSWAEIEEDTGVSVRELRKKTKKAADLFVARLIGAKLTGCGETDRVMPKMIFGFVTDKPGPKVREELNGFMEHLDTCESCKETYVLMQRSLMIASVAIAPRDLGPVATNAQDEVPGDVGHAPESSVNGALIPRTPGRAGSIPPPRIEVVPVADEPDVDALAAEYAIEDLTVTDEDAERQLALMDQEAAEDVPLAELSSGAEAPAQDIEAGTPIEEPGSWFADPVAAVFMPEGASEDVEVPAALFEPEGDDERAVEEEAEREVPQAGGEPVFDQDAEVPSSDAEAVSRAAVPAPTSDEIDQLLAEREVPDALVETLAEIEDESRPVALPHDAEVEEVSSEEVSSEEVSSEAAQLDSQGEQAEDVEEASTEQVVSTEQEASTERRLPMGVIEATGAAAPVAVLSARNARSSVAPPSEPAVSESNASDDEAESADAAGEEPVIDLAERRAARSEAHDLGPDEWTDDEKKQRKRYLAIAAVVFLLMGVLAVALGPDGGGDQNLAKTPPVAAPAKAEKEKKPAKKAKKKKRQKRAKVQSAPQPAVVAPQPVPQPAPAPQSSPAPSDQGVGDGSAEFLPEERG